MKYESDYVAKKSEKIHLKEDTLFSRKNVQPSIVWGAFATFAAFTIEQKIHHGRSLIMVFAVFFLVFFVSVLRYADRI
ncbi:hypothetical protein COV04_02630 [Candidatus Uhrbacteria bacterium CG10_big_fil_rev_8_21_14_0_10_48_11]|uniref:Uncharacterized protein n=1 Tax=Candidatus Uhrbacteria bacterium CG10_big_fil_rev_8_21_14_0_10_48_11 TaxID=1975037 RepID=A0A2M8LEK8_9BACT|nr:MAG: hypothetical protein COV04_02630 [Candidatus Uhrbacteria bacterium CG10_big_fil_rev_8_21_14_0_10_48_11]